MTNDSAQYTQSEIAAIRETDIQCETPECPRCKTQMTRREIGGGSFGLGYARKREWLICGSCHRSAIYDVKRGTRT